MYKLPVENLDLNRIDIFKQLVKAKEFSEIENIITTYDELYKEMVLKDKSNPNAKDLLELLFFEFYTKNEYIRTKLNISRQTATSYLKQLEEVGILSSEKIGKEIIYKNISLFKIAEN